ncbi:MAG TPA: hypothetical protein VFP84_25695 [Kofleriaceae bacterium]|nr:hypothetical protein [Kofleriaceae bacterium]
MITDAELDRAITAARRAPSDQANAALAALQAQLGSERGPQAPALGAVWDALVDVARRDPDEPEVLLARAEARARWAAAARGPGHPVTIGAWSELGEVAEEQCAWDTAIAAWEQIIAAPIDDATDDVLGALAQALRGLGARKLAARQFEAARALFERDLVLSEKRTSSPAQLALSLDSLAVAHEQLGQAARALDLRRRQRAALVASGASPSQLQSVDGKIAALGG